MSRRVYRGGRGRRGANKNQWYDTGISANNYDGHITMCEGRIEALKKFTYSYDCYSLKAQYVNTTQEIGDYIGMTFEYCGNDTRSSILHLESPRIPKPGAKPVSGVDGADDIDERIWEKKVDFYAERVIYLEENIKKAYYIIWGQCSEDIKYNLKNRENFEKISRELDTIGLLKEIKQLMSEN